MSTSHGVRKNWVHLQVLLLLRQIIQFPDFINYVNNCSHWLKTYYEPNLHIYFFKTAL